MKEFKHRPIILFCELILCFSLSVTPYTLKKSNPTVVSDEDLRDSKTALEIKMLLNKSEPKDYQFLYNLLLNENVSPFLRKVAAHVIGEAKPKDASSILQKLLDKKTDTPGLKEICRISSYRIQEKNQDEKEIVKGLQELYAEKESYPQIGNEIANVLPEYKTYEEKNEARTAAGYYYLLNEKCNGLSQEEKISQYIGIINKESSSNPVKCYATVALLIDEGSNVIIPVSAELKNAIEIRNYSTIVNYTEVLRGVGGINILPEIESYITNKDLFIASRIKFAVTWIKTGCSYPYKYKEILKY